MHEVGDLKREDPHLSYLRAGKAQVVVARAVGTTRRREYRPEACGVDGVQVNRDGLRPPCAQSVGAEKIGA